MKNNMKLEPSKIIFAASCLRKYWSMITLRKVQVHEKLIRDKNQRSCERFNIAKNNEGNVHTMAIMFTK